LALATDLLVKIGGERGLVPEARAGDGSVVITETAATTAANEIEILRKVCIIPPSPMTLIEPSDGRSDPQPTPQDGSIFYHESAGDT
jgi:hypothetical protein